MSKSGTKQLTLIMCNYARHEQLHEIIGVIQKQTIKPYIWVWNNDVTAPFVDDRVDWVINSSRNCHGRFLPMLYQMAPTPFVCSMDDDLYPADDELFADAVQMLRRQQRQNTVLGAYGVRLWLGETYRTSHWISVPKGHGQLLASGKPSQTPLNYDVDIVKGRILFLRQAATHALTAGFGHHHADLYTCCTLAGQKRFNHVVSGIFWDRCDLENADNCKPRLLDYPVDEKGYSAMEKHMEERNAICQAWASTCLPDSRVQAKPKQLKRDRDTGATTEGEEETKCKA